MKPDTIAVVTYSKVKGMYLGSARGQSITVEPEHMEAFSRAFALAGPARTYRPIPKVGNAWAQVLAAALAWGEAQRDRAEFLPTGGMKAPDLYSTRFLVDCAEA